MILYLGLVKEQYFLIFAILALLYMLYSEKKTQKGKEPFQVNTHTHTSSNIQGLSLT